MLSREKKKNQVSYLSEDFSKAKASFLVNCIGLNVEQMTELRKSLKQKRGDIKVIRNTLARLALNNHPELKGSYESHLSGPNAFVLAFEDMTEVAKIVDEACKENEVFQIKCGVLEGKELNSQEIKDFAKLPPLKVLQAQFLALLSAPLSKFLGTLQAAPEAFVRILNTYKEKKQN